MYALNIILLFIILLKKEALTTADLLKKPEDIFPEDYDKFEPPFTEEEPAHVYIRMSIMDVDNINDGGMEFSIQCYLVEFWKDFRLNVSIFQMKNNTNRVFPIYLAKYLWVPDLVFDNTRNGMLFHLSVPNTCIKIHKDGTLFRTSRYNLNVGCRMDFRFYPMDTQKCFIKITTLAYPDNKVLLHWTEEEETGKGKSLILTNEIEPLKYQISEPRPYKTTEQWTSGNFTYLYANFTFVRRISGSLFNVYFPSTLVVLLSWISFWLDVEAVPARITLGVTSLLTLATQIVQAHAGLPAISYMTALDVWLFACLFTVFSSLIEFAFSYQLFIISKQRDTDESSQDLINYDLKENMRSANRRPGSVRISASKEDITTIASQFNQKLFHRGSARKKKTSGGFETLPRLNSSPKSLDSICRKAFPLVFSIFSIVYWTYYLFLK